MQLSQTHQPRTTIFPSGQCKITLCMSMKNTIRRLRGIENTVNQELNNSF